MFSRFGLVGLLIVGSVFATGLVGGMIVVPERTALAVQASVPIAIQPPVTAVVVKPANPLTAVVVKPANPLVEPGKVRWHPTAAAAFDAAKASKKPVLVFHMMGQLDHQFC